MVNAHFVIAFPWIRSMNQNQTLNISHTRIMEMDLTYIDYAVVSLTHPGTLKTFQSKDTKSFKLAVGDRDGVLQVLIIRNDEIQICFKTLPGEPIAGLDVETAQDGGYDKIFVSSNTEVKGYTKKGKLFLGFETNLTEPIVAMAVFETDLLVAGSHCMTHYRDCKDIGSYICGDTIVDIAAVQIQNSNRVLAMIACRGGTIHAIERGRVLAIVRLAVGPSVLFSPAKKRDHVYCGTTTGSLYSLSFDRERGSIDMQPYTGLKSESGISAVGWWHSATSHKNPLLILGYTDGLIQIYTVQDDPTNKELQLIFTHNGEEHITSVAGWSKGIVAATRSGRIFGLSAVEDTKSTVSKINKLREEIQELELQVEKERSHYKIATQPLSQGLSAIPALHINDEWGHVEGDGARKLCISLGAPIDILLIQSDAPLVLLDTGPNAALLTKAYGDKGDNELLATYRCQANTQQLEMRIGVTSEGLETTGELCVYVTPLLQPKCSQLLKYHMHPLFWHMPIEEYNTDITLSEFSTLSMSGSFSKAEIHAWLTKLLPEIPSKAPSATGIIFYRSVIINTILKGNYQKGEAEFKSDNITTISIMKDFFSAEATKKKVQLDISCNVNDASIMKVINSLHPKMLTLYDRLKTSKIKNALSELQIDEDGEMMLCKEYADLLKEKKEPHFEKCLDLKQFQDIIVNLYIDARRMKGINVKSKILELKSTLENYNLESVRQFLDEN